MSLNANHTFEDLGEIKCSIVEKNCSPERVNFLKALLEFNGFTVVVVNSPPPKVAAKPAAANPETPVETPPPPPETFTVGVTDLTFNPINAVFNRELKTPEGAIVNPGYWKQEESVVDNEKWYWKS